VVVSERTGVVPQVLRAQSGRIRLLVLGSHCDVLLAAPGYRRTLVKAIDADRRVVLEKGPALRVVFADDAAFPKGEGIAMSVWLTAADPPESSSHVRASDLVGSTAGGHFLAETHAATFSVSVPGRYRLGLFMTINRDEIHGAEQIFAQPVTVADTSSEQVFSLPVTKAAIESAIRNIESQ
jgi:hypothetical protein